MRILIVHNYYKLSGGEDAVVDAEHNLLLDHNHDVKLFTETNNSIVGIRDKINVFMNIVYSSESKSKLENELSIYKPDLVHVHNFFPLLTPSIYDACLEANVPIVQTLHNFRTICPSGLLTRGSNACEDCVNKSPYRALIHRCYKGSLFGTLALARMVITHRKRRTWCEKVDRFIALSQFAKSRFVMAGFPEYKIKVKPNFASLFANMGKYPFEKKDALFVGRLSEEKGIRSLLSAFDNCRVNLRIAGDGPLADMVTRSNSSNIIYLGKLPSEKIAIEMEKALFLLLPSLCYEGFPKVIAEAFSKGLPVFVSKLGSMAEIVEEGITGLHFEAGNAEDLAAKVRWSSEHPEEMRTMGENARQIYDEKYTPERNYEILMSIYQEAIDEKKYLRN
jgi:glycosyltransferase involved in cell wall biosynthesis